MNNTNLWRKSARSYSTGCVELSPALGRVRDSKDPAGPTLPVDVAAFVRAVRAGRFDRLHPYIG